jgi:hypothetical protein
VQLLETNASSFRVGRVRCITSLNRFSLSFCSLAFAQADLVRLLKKSCYTLFFAHFPPQRGPCNMFHILNCFSSSFCSLGFAQADLVRLLDKNASTFRLSVGPVKGRVDFLLASGVDLEGLRTMVHKHPSVLRYRVDRVMQPRIAFLKVNHRCLRLL